MAINTWWLDNTPWTCDCGRRGIPSIIGGALFDFEFVCRPCVDKTNELHRLGGLMHPPVWVEDPSVLVTVKHRRGGRHARTT